MKKAICFAGGGSKGAYQLGAWKALDELGESFDIATGTSIGSINAAFYVQQDFSKAQEMWFNVEAAAVMVNGINLEKSFQSVYHQREQLVPFLKTYIHSKGADVSPFHNMLQQYFDADVFFSSPVDFALMTVKFPSVSPVEVTKEMMREKGNTAWEWLAASAAAFPVFPVMTIDETDYIDGGYYDNLPIASAFKLGAESVVAIDLSYDNRDERYYSHPSVTYIRPTKDLGAFLNFDREAIDFSYNLGYFDTMKVYGKYLGNKYTFSFKDKTLYEQAGQQFIRLLTSMEAAFDFSDSVHFQRINKQKGCVSILCDSIRKEKCTPEELFIAALEEYLILLGFDDSVVYDFEQLIYDLKFEADRIYPFLEYDTETAFKTMIKHIKDNSSRKARKIRIEEDRMKIIIASVIRALQYIKIV